MAEVWWVGAILIAGAVNWYGIYRRCRINCARASIAIVFFSGDGLADIVDVAKHSARTKPLGGAF